MRLQDLKAAKKAGKDITKNKTTKTGYNIEPMQQKHLSAVLAVIEDHDEDDAEAAQISYNREGFEDQYVLLDGSTVVGVTGFRATVNTQATAWLSWTYLAESIQGQNHGRGFVEEIIQTCKEAGFRKLYVSTSDYVDDEDGDIYAQARQFYQNIGFRHELTLPDYFDEDESKIIYVMDLSLVSSKEPSWSATAGFVCTEVFELLECDDTYSFGLELNEEGNNASVAELEAYIGQAKSKEAERLYIGVPSDATTFISTLRSIGFTKIGQLADYYQAGVAEIHFKKDL